MITDVDRRILRLAVPALGTLAVEPLYVLTDTAIVGHLGTASLGGLALAGTVLNTLLWLCNFLAYGITARVAFLTGRGDRRSAAGVAAQGLWLAGILGIPMAVGVALGARPLAAALGGEGAVLDEAVTYMRIGAISMPAVLIALAGQGHLRGLSDTRTPLAVVLVANVVNLVIQLPMVYVLDMGIAGSALSTVIAQLLAGAWFIVLTGRRVATAESRLRPDRSEMWALILIGRHLVVRTGALLAALTLATAVAARVDDATLGGHQVAFQVFIFLALVVDALAIAAQAIVGTDLGAGAEDVARSIARRLLRLGTLTGGAVGLVVIAASPLLPRIFTGDGEVVSRATVALVFLGAMQLPGAVAFVLDGVLMGASDFAYVKWALVAALAVFVPFAVAVLRWPDLGIAGLWTGLLAWMTARAALNWVRFSGRAWTGGAG